MNIKDPRVHELAHRLAALRGSTATAAVRSALEEALANELRNRGDRRGSLCALQERVRGSQAHWLTDEDLYDAEGLPR